MRGQAVRVVWALLALCIPPAAAQDLPTRLQIDSTMDELARISGFRIKRQVSFRSISRTEVGKYFGQRLQENVKPKEVRAEELTLKKFGFVPPDFDLRQSTEKLITEQAAAFYDYRTRQLYLTDWTPPDMRATALIHELAHALADQNYSIGKFLKKTRNDSEATMARQAVVEGQATLLAAEVEYRHRDGKAREANEPAEAYPEFDHAPLYFREMLLFPYLKGSLFQQQVRARDGRRAFREVFEDPPLSTRQIMDVGAYFQHQRTEQPALPGPPPGVHKLKGIVDGPLGGFEHHILLQQYGGAALADELGPAWRGGRYRLYDLNNRTTLIYASRWQDAASARRFFDAYQTVLKGKWKTMAVQERSDSRVTGRGDDGYFELTLDDTRVTSREGWPEPF